MGGDKEISPMGLQIRMLAGAVVSFGKEILSGFSSYLDTRSYLNESQLLNQELPKFENGTPEFVKQSRRDKARSSSMPPTPIHSEVGRRRDSVRPSSPPKGRIHARAIKR